MRNITLPNILLVIINLYFLYFIDKYCCAGNYDMSHTCHQGPAQSMEYTKVIH